MTWPDSPSLLFPGKPSYVRVYSETPLVDLWSQFRHFEVIRYVSEQYEVDQPTAEAVADCVRQAKEYFLSAQASSLLTKPVLIYYGMVSLVKLFFLLTDERLNMDQVEAIERHGHGLKQDDSDAHQDGIYLLERSTITVTATEGKGGILRPRGIFPSLSSRVSPTDTTVWLSQDISMGKLMRYVPQLDDEWRRAFQTDEGYLGLPGCALGEASGLSFIGISDAPSVPHDVEELYGHIDYLDRERFRFEPTETDEPKFRLAVDDEDMAYRLLEREELTEFGNTLPPGWLGARLDSILAMYMLMYGMSIIARYKPHRWSQIIEGRSSPLLPLLERMMFVAQRWWPNLVLNRLTRRWVTFAGPMYW